MGRFCCRKTKVVVVPKVKAANRIRSHIFETGSGALDLI